MGKERRNKSNRTPVRPGIAERAGLSDGADYIEPAKSAPGVNAATSDPSVIDPASVGNNASAGNADGGDGDTSGRKPRSDRGKPRTRREKTDGSTSLIELGSFAELLVSTHAMLATVTGIPELVIAQQEGDTLAKAAGDVLRHYDVPLVSQSTLDHIRLLQVVATIYGTRVFAASMRRTAERAKPVDQPPPPGAVNSAPPLPTGTPPANPEQPLHERFN